MPAVGRGKRLYSRENRRRPLTSMAVLIPLSCERLCDYIEHGDHPLVDASTSSTDRSLLILDCRPFLAHNEAYIQTAINIHCPAILRRRCGGSLPLRTVVPNGDVRQRLLSGECEAVVLYEDQGLPHEDSMALFVCRCLQIETEIKRVYLLEGGFQRFQQQYPQLCTHPPSLLMSSTSSSESPASLKKSCVVTPKAARLSPRPPKRSTSATSDSDQEQEKPVEILPHLYLGNAYHASCKDTLQRLGISALLNVSHTCPNHFEDSFTYKCIPVEDSGSEDIGRWFTEAIDYIEKIKEENGKVLVHCHAGISRSATICMAYLMATKRLLMEEAYEYVKSRRRIISPNFSFMEQLLAFESQIFSPTGKKGCKLSPRACSPLLAVIASPPGESTPTPSCGAQHNVFNFTIAQDSEKFSPSHVSTSSAACSSPAIFV